MAPPRSLGGGGSLLPLAALVSLCSSLVGRGVASPSSGEGGTLRGSVANVDEKVNGPPNRELADAGEPRYTWNGCKCKPSWKLDTVGSCEHSCCNVDNDEFGEWCLIEDMTCEDSDWGYCKPVGAQPTTCQDSPPNWVDAESDSCRDYAFFDWCTKSSEVGRGWNKTWGSLMDFANQGHTAFTACCECGGGTDVTNKCTDKNSWKDSDGDSCETYGKASWCNHMGGYGIGWHQEWGTFADTSSNGMSAVNACCACGGGDNPEKPAQAAQGAKVAEVDGGLLPMTLLGCECQKGWQDVITGKFCNDHCCNPDNDPNGAWCYVKDNNCEDADWGYCREKPPQDKPCVNSPAAWVDAYGYDCDDYQEKNFCTAAGGVGTGWKSAWGTFDMYFHDGHTALTACCACGGGGAREDMEDFNRNCQDKIGWNDTDGDSCATYADDEWCTPTGGYGPGWHEEWGSFADHGKELSAPQACCACGGGSAAKFQGNPHAQGLTRSPARAPSPPPASGPPPSTPKRQTWNGCDCKKSWSFAELSCDHSCCNPDQDEFGNWCAVEDTTCEQADWGYCMPAEGNTEHDHGSCTDIEGWTDLEADNCWNYENQKWCKNDGTAGSGWDQAWGTLDDYFHDGHSSLTACCVCGGGKRGAGDDDDDDRDEDVGDKKEKEEAEAEVCVDVPGWKDPEGDGCAAYEKSRWCTASGGFGIGWHEEWGSFRGEVPAPKACCYCGGGSTGGYSWAKLLAASAAAARGPQGTTPGKRSASFGGAAVAVVLGVLAVGSAAGIGGYVLYKRSKEENDDDDGAGGVGARRIGRAEDY